MRRNGAGAVVPAILAWHRDYTHWRPDGSEVFGEADLETVVRAADSLSDDPTEVNGQPLADLVIATDLLLQLASSQGKICGVAAINFDPEVEFLGELMGERRTAGENRTSGLDADGSSQSVAGERGPGIHPQRVLAGERPLKDAIQIVIDEA